MSVVRSLSQVVVGGTYENHKSVFASTTISHRARRGKTGPGARGGIESTPMRVVKAFPRESAPIRANRANRRGGVSTREHQGIRRRA